jgi:hypothetical protein
MGYNMFFLGIIKEIIDYCRFSLLLIPVDTSRCRGVLAGGIPE